MAKKKSNAQPQPTREEFVAYAREPRLKLDPKLAGDQWDVWDAGDWCDSNGTPIMNWKNKLATFAKCGFGVFNNRYKKPERNRAAEADEEYEQRQRYKPDNL